MGWRPTSASEIYQSRSLAYLMSELSPSLHLRLDYRQYFRRFSTPLKTAHGEWSQREGVLIRLDAPDGSVGYGEAAPVPHFQEPQREPGILAEQAALENLGGVFQVDHINEITLPTLRWALECALSQLADPALPGVRVPVAGLLPAGEAALGALSRQLGTGRRAFKWKIGVGPAKDEIALAHHIAAALPKGVRLRLDANGGLDEEAYAAWRAWIREHRKQVDYLEQPLPVGQEDVIFAQAEDAPVALDESVVGVDQLTEMAARYPRAVFIIKPSLLGSRAEYLRWRAANGLCRVVYSSCFETAIGLKAVWEMAALDWPPLSPAGLDTVSAFENDGLCPLKVGWELTKADWEAGIEERVWDAL